MASTQSSSGLNTSSGTSTSTGSNDSRSASSSQSFIPGYEQTPFLMQLARYSQQLGEHAADWGTDQFNNNQDLTDETVNNYLDASRTSRDLAGNQIDRSQHIFQPQEDALVRDANTFSSNARIRQDMGAAEAEAGQGADAGRQNAIRDLQSYGVDPSSGRYAALDSASRASEAASKVAAGQKARQNTENVGRQLRGQVIQVGQQYPGQAIGAIRAGYEGLAGAHGAAMANTDRGVALTRLPNDFLQTGMSLKYPPLGNSSNSSSTSTGRTQSHSQNQSQGSTSSSGSSTDPARQPSGGGGGGAAPRGGGDGGYSPGGAGGNSANSGDGLSVPGYRPMQWGPQGPGIEQVDDSAGDTPTGGDYGGYDSNYDASGSQDYGGYNQGYGSYGEYATGGAVGDVHPAADPDATQGGFVSQDMSPSAGADTDDVDAKLNANEFVIPKDVTLWKGQEFFQKLIASAREARVTGTVARGKTAPAR